MCEHTANDIVEGLVLDVVDGRRHGERSSVRSRGQRREGRSGGRMGTQLAKSTEDLIRFGGGTGARKLASMDKMDMPRIFSFGIR